MEPIKLRFTPTVNDYTRMTRPLLPGPLGRFGTIVKWALAAGAVLLIISVLWADRLGLPDFLAPLLMVIAVIVVLRWFASRTRAFSASKEIKAGGDVTYEFTDDHVVIKDATGEFKQAWSVFQKAVATQDYYILILTVNRLTGRSIPRRAFESPEQENAFRELLARKLNFEE